MPITNPPEKPMPQGMGLGKCKAPLAKVSADIIPVCESYGAIVNVGNG